MFPASEDAGRGAIQCGNSQRDRWRGCRQTAVTGASRGEPEDAEWAGKTASEALDVELN